jgi:metal-responsive CopG/Arc/MetJ family transcriptional regulator
MNKQEKQYNIPRTYSLPKLVVELLDQLIDKKIYKSRTAALTDAVKNLAKEKGLWSDLNEL